MRYLLLFLLLIGCSTGDESYTESTTVHVAGEDNTVVLQQERTSIGNTDSVGGQSGPPSSGGDSDGDVDGSPEESGAGDLDAPAVYNRESNIQIGDQSTSDCCPGGGVSRAGNPESVEDCIANPPAGFENGVAMWGPGCSCESHFEDKC